MAILYKQNGDVIKDIQPKNGKRFTLEELYEMLDCELVERLFIDGTEVIMIVDEEGKLKQKPQNIAATMVYHRRQRMNTWDWIAGDALVCRGDQF